MHRKARAPVGWVTLKEGADRVGLHFETLRNLVNDGKFTRLRKTPGENAAIYLHEDEITEFLNGGLDAVEAFRLAKKAARDERAAREMAGAGA